MKKAQKPISVLVALNKSIISRTRKLSGIFRAASEHGGIELKLMDEGRNLTPKYADREIAEGVKAFIIGAFNVEKTVTHLGRIGFPMVTIFKIGKPYRNSCEILTDNKSVACEALRALAKTRHFASFAYYPATDDPIWSQERDREFRKAVKKSGHCPCVTLSEAECEKQLLALPKPIGVFAANDTYAAKVLNISAKNGLAVPQDVSIVSVDNEEFLCESVSPTLTSIEPDFEREGYEAMQAVIRMLSGQSVSPSIRCGFRRLVARNTTFSENPGVNVIDRALEYIEKNATSGITVADVCAHMRISRRLLNLRFREHGATPPGQAIVKRRLEALRKLLSSSSLPISTICKRCGFGSENHPKKLFRQRYGMTMREFRSRHSFPPSSRRGTSDAG